MISPTMLKLLSLVKNTQGILGIRIYKNKFHIGIISNFPFPFITYFLTFNDFSKNENKLLLDFCFLLQFSTRFLA
jgi:hypothetical protein